MLPRMVMPTKQMTEWINNTMQHVKLEMPDMSDDDLMPEGALLIDAEDEPLNLSSTAAVSRQKLMDTLSFSFAGGSFVSAMSGFKPDPELLSQSCFSQIRLDRGPNDFEDDELTNLDWLQQPGLLKNISGSLCHSPESEEELMDLDSLSGRDTDSLNGSLRPSSPLQHPSHIPYNPLKHINSKPPYSFSVLIFMAIEDSPPRRLPVKDIYEWILSHFPFFQSAPNGWKNSIRHNLSLNKCFRKVDKHSNVGKGAYWSIDPDYRSNLLQALRKTPYHPYQQLQMVSSPHSTFPTPKKTPTAGRRLKSANTISPHMFPLLSKRLNHKHPSSIATDLDAANALVSLRRSSLESNSKSERHWPRTLRLANSRSRSPSPPEFGSRADRSRSSASARSNTSNISSSREGKPLIIITQPPSQDHNYGCIVVPRALRSRSRQSNASSIDGEYEFSDGGAEIAEQDTVPAPPEQFDSAEEEEMELDYRSTYVEQAADGREMEGVNALLNLASIATSQMSRVIGLPTRTSSKINASETAN